jgi:hypothetical protein
MKTTVRVQRRRRNESDIFGLQKWLVPAPNGLCRAGAWTTGAAFDFLGDLNWNFDIPIDSSSFESSNIGSYFPMPDVPNALLSTFNPTFVGLPTDTWNTLIWLKFHRSDRSASAQVSQPGVAVH